MYNWHTLVRFPETSLARLDIAAVSWACGLGLPGCDTISLKRCSELLDEWAARCKAFTNQVMPLFWSGRCDYPDSEPRFRVQALITHLQCYIGVHFRHDRRSEDSVFDPADTFVQGVLATLGGTCGNLPVIYAAVGRRLGYPIDLATTVTHLYCRWEGKEKFNIEASGDGISFLPDEYFRTGKFQMDPEAVRWCGHLKSLSPREELAHFLCQRGECWMQEKNYNEAVTGYLWAAELDPTRGQYPLLAVQAIRNWDMQLKSRLPRGFPTLKLSVATSPFKNVPKDVQREVVGMRVTENLLNDAGYDQKWWSSLRKNMRPAGLPATLSVNYRWEPITTGDVQ